MHLRVYPGLLVGGSITFFWGMNQKGCKLSVSIEHTGTLDNVPVVKLVLLSRDHNFLSDKLRKAVWELSINYPVEFL